MSFIELPFAGDRQTANHLVRSSHARRVVALVLICLTLPNATMGQKPAEIREFEPPQSTLGQFTTQLKDVVKLKPRKGMLIPEFATNGNEARSEFQAVARKVSGASGSSSSSSGGNSWSTNIRGQKLSTTAGYGQQHYSPYNETVLVADNDSFYMQLEQHDGNRPRVLVTAKEDGTLHARIDDDFGAFTFEFEQDKNGKVRCLELGPESQFADNASSFDELAADNPDYVAKRLSPLFRYAGLGVPPTRFSPFVRKLVINKLRPVDAEQRAAFRKLVSPLDGDDFEEREKATKEIEEKFDDWASEIQSAVSDNEFSVEVRARLKKIFDANVDDDLKAVQSLAVKANLDQDPEYLIWLWESLQAEPSSEQSESDIGRIVDQLEKLTDKSFGQDLAAWQAWDSENQDSKNASEQQPITTDQLLATKGVLNDLAETTADLLRLKQEGDHLVVDRAFWKEKLGGKTIQELTNEIQETIRNKGLPTTWFVPGGGNYPSQTVDYPQVVFERLTADLEMDSTVAQRVAAYSRYIRNTANREFIGENLVGILKVHQLDQRRQVIFAGNNVKELDPVKQEFLQLELKESDDQKREIWFHDDREGNVVAGLRFSKLNCEIRLVQRKEPDQDGNRFFLFDVRNGEVQYFRQPDFASFRQQHETYWQNTVQPIFSMIGIDVKSD